MGGEGLVAVLLLGKIVRWFTTGVLNLCAVKKEEEGILSNQIRNNNVKHRRGFRQRDTGTISGKGSEASIPIRCGGDAVARLLDDF